MNISLSCPSTMEGGKEYPVQAYVVNSDGMPVKGISVEFSASDGNFTDNEAFTDENGMAETTYIAPRREIQSSITLHVSVYDSGQQATYTAEEYIVLLPPSIMRIYLESTPSEILRLKNGTASNISIQVVNGEGDILGPNSTEIEYQIAPEGASITFTGYENGTWHYSVLATAPENRTKQYSISITALWDSGSGSLLTDSRRITLVVVGEHAYTPPPCSEEESEKGSIMVPVIVSGAIMALAAASILMFRKYKVK